MNFPSSLIKNAVEAKNAKLEKKRLKKKQKELAKKMKQEKKKKIKKNINTENQQIMISASKTNLT